MALIRADRVKESSTSTGTGAFALAGADSTYRTFATVCAVADTVYYAIAHRSANEWEVGLGTYSAVNTLTRTTVHASSNANAAVTFSAGTKDVLLALTKTQLETYATLAGTETLTNKTINASSNTITNVSLTTGVTGTLPLANGGTGTTTAQLAINALAGAVTSGSYLRGNGTNVVMATIQAADVPNLNQNTTGTASNVTGIVAIANGGTGASDYATARANLALGTMSTQNNTNVLIIGGSISNTTINGNISGNAVNVTGTVAIANGGTGQTTAANAINALLPSQSTNTGKFLTTNGTVASWATVTSNAGTVTSVGGTGTVSGITLTGTVTSSGNLTLGGTLSVTASNFSSQTANTVLAAPNGAAGTPTFRALVAADIPTLNQNTTGTASGSVSGTASYLAKFTGTNVVGNSLIYDNGTNIGIGTTTTSDKLHVIGNMRAGNYTGGVGTYLALTGDLPNYANGLYPTLKSDGNIYLSANGKYTGYIGNSQNAFGLLSYTTAGADRVLINPDGTSYFAGGAITTGLSVGSASPSQMFVAAQAATTKGMIVRGASGQSANLQEWQNNAGTVLASVASGGDFSAPSISSIGAISSGTIAVSGTDFNRITLTRTHAFNPYSCITFTDAIGSCYVSGGGEGLLINTSSANKRVLQVVGAASQTANLTEWQNSAGSVLSAVRSNGAIQPASMADSAATNNSIYYSTTASKLVYKDSAGTVNNLY